MVSKLSQNTMSDGSEQIPDATQILGLWKEVSSILHLHNILLYVETSMHTTQDGIVHTDLKGLKS